jgi:O-antigen/teichoic acid export membrane protein
MGEPVIRERSYKRRLPAGIFDAGFASIATFAAGLAAVNLLGDADRGVYAVFFTAFLLGTALPRNLIFTPAEVRSVAFPVDSRLVHVPRSLLLGLGPAVLGIASILIAVAVTWRYSTPPVIVALAVTTGITTVLSPLQDHVRKMLHIATLSWRAASVSIIQFFTVVAAIGVMFILEVEKAWIPFGALAAANAVSLTVSRLLVRQAAPSSEPDLPTLRTLVFRGRWLVVQSAAPSVMGFAVAAIIPALAGPEALGFAESARVVAQPILVLAAGLTAVLAPRSMKAGMDRDVRSAHRTSKIYLAIIGVGGLGYLAVAGWDWFLNPMSFIVPSAYVMPGLVALTVIANILTAGVYLQGNELLGARREKTYARIAWSTSPILLLGGLTAGTTGAYARALGRAGESIASYIMQDAALRGVYEGGPAPAGDTVPEATSTRADRD